MLGADAGIVQSGRDRVRVEDLARSSCRTASASRAAPRAPADGSGAAWRPGVDALARRLDADELDALVVDEGREDPDRVRAPADAGDDGSGSRPSCSRICARASSPMTRWKSRTIVGIGCGPTTEPMM